MKRFLALLLAMMIVPTNITVLAETTEVKADTTAVEATAEPTEEETESNIAVTTEEIVAFEDDFEDMDAGGLPEGKTVDGEDKWIGYSKNVLIKKTDYGKSMRITDNTSKNNKVSTVNLHEFFWAGDAVLEMDVNVSSAASRTMLYFQDSVANSSSDFKVAEFIGGKIYVCGKTGAGNEIGTYTPGAWYHVKAEIKYNEQTFDVTITGENTKIEKKDLAWTTSMGTKCNLSILVLGSNDSAYAFADNVKVYRRAGVEYNTEKPPLPEFYIMEPKEGNPAKGKNPIIEGTSAFDRISAINYSKQLGASQIQSCYDNPEIEPIGDNVSSVGPGGYLVYEGIDFGDGARGFHARVGSWHSGGLIEIRLDDINSEPVGVLSVTVTGDWQNWETQSCEIKETSGVHDVYLLFVRSSADAPIASLNWFTFTKSVPTEKYSYVPNPKNLIWNTDQDTWVATDALGREVETNETLGDVKEEKYVGLFYFPHISKKYGKVINDVTREEAENPDFYCRPGVSYYWAEPYFGYYLGQDEYVIRKHAQMFVDAGIDFLYHDISNGLLYAEEWMAVFRVFDKIRREGGQTPQIMFFCNKTTDKGKRDVDYLWEHLYSKGLYEDLWFKIDGKPVINANMSYVDPEIAKNFTVRQSWAWSTQSWFGNGKDAWTWLDNYPQAYGWHESKDIPEQISVCIAQHATTSIGRSYHNGEDPEIKDSGVGLNFSEQWSRALEVDPKIVYVTGWNEWFATAVDAGSSGTTYLGRQLTKGQGYTVDQYNMEYSRDAEPMKGGFGDNYYYQLAQNVRKYKGVDAIPKSSGSKIIDVSGDFSQWDNVFPYYKDDRGDTEHRDCLSWMGKYRYINETGRNDIDYTKVTYDDNYVYFYAHTQEELTEPVLKNWMTLYIDSDRNHNTGWNGYDYVVNRTLKDDTTGILETADFGDWYWEKKGEVKFNASGNEIQFAISRDALGLKDKEVTFDFKWCDNSVTDGDPMEFMDKGDAAPNERYNYRFITGGSAEDYALTAEEEAILTMNEALIVKDGSHVAYKTGSAEFYDETDANVVAIAEGAATLVPARYVFESLGAVVNWSPSGTLISYKDKTLTVVQGMITATLNGATVTLKSAPKMVNDLLYMNVSDIAEKLFEYATETSNGITAIYMGRRNNLDFGIVDSLYNTDCSLTALYNKENAEEQEIMNRPFAQAFVIDKSSADVSYIATLDKALIPVEVPEMVLKSGQLQPKYIYANSYQIDGANEYLPLKSVDGDTAADSSWRNENESYIVYDLGEVKTVNSLKMCFFNGAVRVYRFSVHVSDDGENWTVAKDEFRSSGNNPDFDEFILENTKARFVRIVGFGSSANMWNGYCEVEIYGQ